MSISVSSTFLWPWVSTLKSLLNYELLMINCFLSMYLSPFVCTVTVSPSPLLVAVALFKRLSNVLFSVTSFGF